MAFPVSPSNGDRYGDYEYIEANTAWKVYHEETPQIISDKLTLQGGLYTHIKAIASSTAGGTTFPIARVFVDVTNWTNLSITVEAWQSMFQTSQQDYGMALCRWGFNSAPDIVQKITGPGPSWSGATLFSGNTYFRDLNFYVAQYRYYTLKLSFRATLITNPASGSSNGVYVY